MSITTAELVLMICTKCKVEKPPAEFYKDRSTPSGYMARCKVCKKEAKREYDQLYRLRPERKVALKEYTEIHKEEIAARLKRWQEKNKEHVKAQRAEFYKLNRERLVAAVKVYRNKHKAQEKCRNLKRLYNLSVTDYHKLLESQGAKCAGCGIPQEELNKPLYVDHDHDTGKVRGLLCMKCNMTLGLIDDNPSVLKQLIGYLERTLCPSK